MLQKVSRMNLQCIVFFFSACWLFWFSYSPSLPSDDNDLLEILGYVPLAMLQAVAHICCSKKKIPREAKSIERQPCVYLVVSLHVDLFLFTCSPSLPSDDDNLPEISGYVPLVMLHAAAHIYCSKKSKLPSSKGKGKPKALSTSPVYTLLFLCLFTCPDLLVALLCIPVTTSPRKFLGTFHWRCCMQRLICVAGKFLNTLCRPQILKHLKRLTLTK